MAAGLLGFLALTANFFWVNNLRVVQTVNTDTATQAEARAALERVAREVREVAFSGSSYAISTMGASQMVFQRSVTTDNGNVHPACGTPPYTITVTLQGSAGALNLGYACASGATNTVTRALAGNLAATNGLVLSYLDKDLGSTGVTNTNVRYVSIALSLTPSGVQDTTLRTLVALRNTY